MRTQKKGNSGSFDKDPNPVGSSPESTESNDTLYPTRGVPVGPQRALALSTVIEEKRGAAEAARAIAQLTADWLTRTCTLADDIDNLYRPQISSAQLSDEEKAEHMKDYVKVYSEVFGMFHTANLDYLQCHGIYRANVSTLGELSQPGVGPVASTSEDKTPEQLEAEYKQLGQQLMAAKLQRRLEEGMTATNGTAIDQSARKKVTKMMADMMVEKKYRFGIPLPEEIELPTTEVEEVDSGDDDK